MELQMFDSVKFEKATAAARFRTFSKLRQAFEISAVFAAVAWSSPPLLKIAADFSSACFFNHHVVFLIGNVIIVLLFMLCRQNGDGANDFSAASGGDLYDEYVKYSEAAAAASRRESSTDPPPPENAEIQTTGGDQGRRHVLNIPGSGPIVESSTMVGVGESEELAAAVEKAARQIERFKRTQSEKLRREMAVRRPRKELRRAETAAEEMERLSSEEFRRRVDAFIDQHWCSSKRTTVNSQNNYQLLKME